MYVVCSCDADSGAVESEAFWDKAEAMEELRNIKGDLDYKWATLCDVYGNVLKRVDNLPTED